MLACSLAVALLWGGNIGGLYPVFQVAIAGESLQDWVEGEITDSRKKIDDIKQRIANAANERGLAEKPHTIAKWEAQLDAEEAALTSARRLQPWVDRFLPHDPFITLVVVVTLLFSAIVMRQLLLVIGAMLRARLKSLISIRLQKQFFAHVLRIDLETLGKLRPSGMMTHMKDTEKVCGGVTLILESAIREPAKMIVCLIGAGLICWRLLLFALVLAPIAGIVIRTLGRSVRRISNHNFEISRNVKRVLYDVLTGLPVVQLCTAEASEQSRFDSFMADSFRRQMKMAFYVSMSKALTEVFGLGTVCVTLVAGAYLVLNEQTHIFGVQICDRPLGLAAILVFYGLLIGMTDPVRRFGKIFTDMQHAIAAADRLFPLLDQPASIREPQNPAPVPSPHRYIEFQEVHFKYQDGTPVLNAVNLGIRVGETLAIVGLNGCGKTSLINLLPRFYDPSRGTITIDGIELHKFGLDDLRRRIGYIMQNPVIFDGTVRDNITYGLPRVSEDQIVKAAKLAQAHQFITTHLANGYDSAVGANGGSLSGGQRQRIALARVLLRDPEIVILDEATSQVDREGETNMHQTLEGFLQRRTTLIVTHRLSTLDLADRIAVMSNGCIVDVGTHDELLGRCEFYRELRSANRKRAA